MRATYKTVGEVVISMKDIRNMYKLTALIDGIYKVRLIAMTPNSLELLPAEVSAHFEKLNISLN